MSGFVSGYVQAAKPPAYLDNSQNNTRGIMLKAPADGSRSVPLPDWGTIKDMTAYISLFVPLEAIAVWKWAKEVHITTENETTTVSGHLDDAFWMALLLSVGVLLLGFFLSASHAKTTDPKPNVAQLWISVVIAPIAFLFWAMLDDAKAFTHAGPKFLTDNLDNPWLMLLTMLVAFVLYGFKVTKLREE